MNRRGVTATAAASLAALTLAASALALTALNAGGDVRMGPVRLMALAAGHDRRAERLLAAEPASPADLEEARRLSQGALAQFPYDTAAWLRLAYIDSIRHGRLSPEGVEMLRRSYDLVPVDVHVGVWRVRFTLENAATVPRDLRDRARNEASALWRNPRRRAELKQTQPAINDPAGRLTLALWLNRFERHAGK